MIRATDLNLFPMNDPVGAVVQCAHAGNVDSVFVAGKAVKRGGKLLYKNMDRMLRLAREARDHIFSQYGNPDGLWLL